MCVCVMEFAGIPLEYKEEDEGSRRGRRHGGYLIRKYVCMCVCVCVCVRECVIGLSRGIYK